ncbi:hypothetical protein [Marimonas arenosa]|uniref:Uncharacterized protein n=1 Tax=Marimonas arenosa TaxID=1795305 RepID=A0AAE3WEF1_9RHOB|nr:hypothetical protein [Marimonas arenosa]MDQ2090212.1 hypothetical protein [Marimonas arenosa]
MEHTSFRERLAKIEEQAGRDLVERSFDVKAERQAPHERKPVRSGRAQDEYDDGAAVFWTFYGMGAILMSTAYVLQPERAPTILVIGLPVFGIVGIVKVTATIRRRGFSLGRDGDGFLNVIETVSDMFKMVK